MHIYLTVVDNESKLILSWPRQNVAWVEALLLALIKHFVFVSSRECFVNTRIHYQVLWNQRTFISIYFVSYQSNPQPDMEAIFVNVQNGEEKAFKQVVSTRNWDIVCKVCHWLLILMISQWCALHFDHCQTSLTCLSSVHNPQWYDDLVTRTDCGPEYAACATQHRDRGYVLDTCRSGVMVRAISSLSSANYASVGINFTHKQHGYLETCPHTLSSYSCFLILALLE